MKTYLVEWYNKTRNGRWRDYRKVVKTGDLEKYVRENLRLVVGCMAYGFAKGTFRCAVEVEDANKFGYVYKTKFGGERWFTRDTDMEMTVASDKTYYDHKLKGWLVG